MSRPVKIIVSGGGTGGHIFPAVAIANALKLKYPTAEILFVGAKGRMEMEKIPEAGYPIKGLWISGLQRKLDLKNLSFPFKVISSLLNANAIIKDFKPDVAIGTGGYASGPLLYAAAKNKIPTLIQEQNSYPGITNKLLGKVVDTICVSFEGMGRYFPKHKLAITGSPIRDEILNLKVTQKEGLDHFGLKEGMPTLLIIGGSQGARKVNEVLIHNLEVIAHEGVQLIWQTGIASFESCREAAASSTNADNIKVLPFIQQMDKAYVASDLIISRAGAIAIAEIIAVEKPAIFIPLPSAAEDHQTKNAQTLVDGKAAVLVKENEAQEKLPQSIVDLMKDASSRRIMVQNLKRYAHPAATAQIVEAVVNLMDKRKEEIS